MLDFGFYNIDCMEGMKEFPDKYFDLAIVDPPYGNGGGEWKNADGSRFGERFDRYKASREDRGNLGGKVRKKIISWDTAPEKAYFDELFRVSRNQIIWGGNYFQLPSTRCFLIWEKTNIPETFTMSMCEYAWTSFNDNSKIYKGSSIRNATSGKFHPTEKPIDLYMWLLDKYAKPGDIILDTHVGSASSLIACHKMRHNFVGFEIDPEYYRQAKERLDAEMAQMSIYDFIGE